MDSIELYQKIGLLPEDIRLLRESAQCLPLEKLDLFLDGMTCMETAEQAYLGLKEWLDAYDWLRPGADGTDRNPAAAGHDRSSGSAAAGCFGSCAMLYCHLESARRAHEKYRAMGISERIFIDTMKCFSRFMNECQVRYGSRYFDRSFWTWRQTGMRLFRLGALEYEMSGKRADGFPNIHMHIPSGADLSEPSVNASLREAEEFFRCYYPAYDGAEYVCDSWLLAPALKSLLPENSRILAFAGRFDVTHVNEEERPYMEWLFQAPDDTPLDDLPERTSLQRAAKAYLLRGGTIGEAYGVLRK